MAKSHPAYFVEAASKVVGADHKVEDQRITLKDVGLFNSITYLRDKSDIPLAHAKDAVTFIVSQCTINPGDEK